MAYVTEKQFQSLLSYREKNPVDPPQKWNRIRSADDYSGIFADEERGHLGSEEPKKDPRKTPVTTIITRNLTTPPVCGKKRGTAVNDDDYKVSNSLSGCSPNALSAGLTGEGGKDLREQCYGKGFKPLSLRRPNWPCEPSGRDLESAANVNEWLLL